MNALFNLVLTVMATTRLGLQTLPQRFGSSAATLFGIGGVVAVMVGVLSIAEGFRQAITTTGSPENVIVLRSGAESEMMSGLTLEDTKIIADAPGLKRSGGEPMVSAELFVMLALPKFTTGTDANVPMRGVGPHALEIRDEIKFIEGGPFTPGRTEVVAGAGAAGQFAGLHVGNVLKLSGLEWKVVGIFSDEGGIAESEVWTDAAVLQPAYRRENAFQSVYGKLESVSAFQEFKDALTADPRLNVRVLRQSEFYASQADMLYRIVTGLGTLVAGLMGLGAVFGALNTMYSSVSARTQEIATLRALGFGSIPVVCSVLLESLILSLVGGAIGGGLAYLAFDGYQTATMNWQTFSQVSFAFAVTPALLGQGIVYSALMGLVGGLFPAIRAARMPVAQALRQS